MPYCKSLCWYCGCNTRATTQDGPIEAYLKVLLKELALVADRLPGRMRVSHLALGGGTPAILKTRRMGYDGKGQARIMSPADADRALADMAGAPAVLEGFIHFTHEVSIIGARGLDGAVACYDPGENVHEDGILRTTTVPANLKPSQRTDAVLLAANILNALDYVGVMGVELFVTPTGLIVNEIAPRVHNSGHWTQNGCTVCQFEQHIRAVAGWPLGSGARHADVVMENLIGNDMDRVPELARTDAAIHLYGKAEVKLGRKMGHVNRIVAKG